MIAESAGLGNITKSSLEKSLSQFRKEIKSFCEKILYDIDPIKMVAGPVKSVPSTTNDIISNPSENVKCWC